MTKRQFNFGDTPVAKMSEDIRENEQHKMVESVAQRTQANEAQSTISQEESRVEVANMQVSPAQPVSTIQPVKAKKSTNGIVIDVPMEDYMKLTILKLQTGRTLKELALQAIQEFVERNKIG